MAAGTASLAPPQNGDDLPRLAPIQNGGRPGFICPAPKWQRPSRGSPRPTMAASSASFAPTKHGGESGGKRGCGHVRPAPAPPPVPCVSLPPSLSSGRRTPLSHRRGRRSLPVEPGGSETDQRAGRQAADHEGTAKRLLVRKIVPSRGPSEAVVRAGGGAWALPA